MGITKVTVIVLLSVVRITEGCLGGFGGGGGQQCCPPHAAPICGSSCSSGGPIPSYSAPQQSYNAPIAYPPQNQPLPIAPSSYAQPPPNYNNNYNNYYPSSNQQIPIPPPPPPAPLPQGLPQQQITQPASQSYPQPRGPTNAYRGGNNNNINAYPQQQVVPTGSSGAAPAHIPPSVTSVNKPYAQPNTLNKNKETEDSAKVQGEQGNNPFRPIDEEDNATPAAKSDNQKQVQSAKKVQESNSNPVDEDNGERRTQHYEEEIQEHVTQSGEHTNSEVKGYGEEEVHQQASEEHSTGYRHRV